MFSLVPFSQGWWGAQKQTGIPRRSWICHARVELDVGLDCQLALLCAVHAVLRATLSWSRVTIAFPNRKQDLAKHIRELDRLLVTDIWHLIE